MSLGIQMTRIIPFGGEVTEETTVLRLLADKLVLQRMLKSFYLRRHRTTVNSQAYKEAIKLAKKPLGGLKSALFNGERISIGL